MTLSPAEIARLHEFREKNRRGRNGVPKNGRVTATDCRAWQTRRKRGERPVDIADETGWSSDTVKKHASGRCQHD